MIRALRSLPILCAGLCYAPALWAAGPCSLLLNEIALTKSRILHDDLNTHRGLGLYFAYFPELIPIVENLTREKHWLDSGAGAAGAHIEYLLNGRVTMWRAGPQPGSHELVGEVEFKKQKDLARLTSVTAAGSLVDQQLQARLKQNHDFNYLWGRFIEDIPRDEIGQVDLITDLMGALAYSDRLDHTMNSLLMLLKPNGQLFSVLENTFIVDINGKMVPLRDWFDSISGVEVEWDLVGVAGPYFRITRISEVIKVPELELVSFKDNTPPERVYLWKR